MSDLWHEIVNSDWQAYARKNPQQDRLFQPEWIQQLIDQDNLQVTLPLSSEAIYAFQSLRTTMQRMIEAFSAGDNPLDRDFTELNTYLAATPAILRLEKKGEAYCLIHLPLQPDWHWLLREIAASFATFITSHNPARIKRCGNPDCRWIYFDQSRQKNQRWCNDRCANLMRVRHFREVHKSHDDSLTDKQARA